MIKRNQDGTFTNVTTIQIPHTETVTREQVVAKIAELERELNEARADLVEIDRLGATDANL